MDKDKVVPSPKAGRPRPARARYRSPTLFALGSLRGVTLGSGGKGADGVQGMTRMSDRRAKRDVVRIGEHRLGLGIYQFRYRKPYAALCGAGRHIGVMADEVADRYPDAVLRDADGYLMVDYGRLFG